MSNTLHTLEPSETIEQLHDSYFPPYITLAHMFNAPQVWEIKPRTLTQSQFQYVVEGAAEYTIEGKSYVTRRGDLIYHAPHVLHSVKTVADEPYLCISVVFHFGSSRFPLDEMVGPSRMIGNFADHSVDNKFSQLVSCYNQPGMHNQLLAQGLLLHIIHDLHQWTLQRTRTKKQEKTKAKIVLVRNYIVNHYDRNFRHEELEEVSGLSRNYIISQFRNLYGMTPFDYLTLVRIEKAKELAVQTHLSFSEISQLVGYADVHTFGRMFKNKTGISLSQFCSSLVTG